MGKGVCISKKKKKKKIGKGVWNEIIIGGTCFFHFSLQLIDPTNNSSSIATGFEIENPFWRTDKVDTLYFLSRIWIWIFPQRLTRLLPRCAPILCRGKAKACNVWKKWKKKKKREKVKVRKEKYKKEVMGDKVCSQSTVHVVWLCFCAVWCVHATAK